ncbi:aldolase/citrate lyase/malate synthase family protein [Nesterenkonia halotolerans]|uniref:malate synthase n=1 Tax=Nesterenkonia halotolerans TaxID=225325 RepID=A0ABR9J950_9MICC|nr:malate synthase [Nesterenkonia halotolerans]
MNAQTSIAPKPSTRPETHAERMADPGNGITINGITLTAARASRQNEVFTADALSFLSSLHREFGERIAALDPTQLQPERNFAPSPAGHKERAMEAEASWKALVDKHLAQSGCAFATPRRLTRSEDRIFSQGQPLSAGLVDFGLHIQRCARRLVAEKRAPFISLLGLEREEELEIWQEMFARAEELIGLPAGTIRAITFSSADDDRGGAILVEKRAR